MTMWWYKSLFSAVSIMLSVPVVMGAPLELADRRNQLIFLDAGNWKTDAVEGRRCLVLDVPGPQRPPVRRPGEFALWADPKPVGDFTVEALTLEPAAVVNRDICLIFGYRDDTHFYYAHVSSNSDNKVHNVIMRVDGDTRVRINKETDPEPRLADGWRTVRIRHAAGGMISVFVDDMNKPLMTAADSTYPVGKIGFGTFDDRAAFATLEVH